MKDTTETGTAGSATNSVETSVSALALLLLFISPIFMSSNMIVARFMAGQFPPHALALGRWSVAFLILLPFVGGYLWRHRDVVWAERYQLLLAGALGMWVCGAFVYLGGQTTTATNIGLIYASSPLMITGMSAIFFNEKQSPVQILGVFVGFAGLIYIISKGDFQSLLSLEFTQGDLWILASSIGWALYSIVLKFKPSKLATTPRLAAIIFGGILILLPFTIWESLTYGAPEFTQTSVLAILFLALIPALAAYLCYSKLQTLVTASVAGMTLFLAPIANSVMAWGLLGESFQTYHWLGSVFIFAGLWMALKKKGKKKTKD